MIFEFLGTHLEKLLSFLTLLLESDVHRVLIETINKLDEVCFQELEVLVDSNLEGLERLRDELFFVVLSG